MVERKSEKTIVLASASPRRKALLEQIGLKFEVEASNHVESVKPELKLKPHEMVKAISQEKALAVAWRHRNAIVIAADTVGLLKGEILGKPETVSEAHEMLTAISGKSHAVITGFTILDTSDDKMVSKSVETRVHIKKLSNQEIDAYIVSGEPLDKAGAYAIQGLGAAIVERIEGDYSNVVGLPLSALAESLKEFGVRVL